MVRRRLLILAVFAVAVVSAVYSSPPLDFWWHLAAGKWISEHGAVPRVELFSWASANREWVAYSWLFELLIYRLFIPFGHLASALFAGSMMLAIVYHLDAWIAESGNSGRSKSREMAMLVLGVWALFDVLSARTWLVSILFLLLELRLLPRIRNGAKAGEAENKFRLERGLESRWLVAAVTALFVAWANLHIQFVLGLGVLALAGLTERDKAAKTRLLKILGLAFVATLANPYGYRVYQVVWEYLMQGSPALVVRELRPLSFHSVSAWVTLVLVVWAGVDAWRRGLRWPQGFAIAFFVVGTVLAMRMARDVWVCALGSLALLSASAEGELGDERGLADSQPDSVPRGNPDRAFKLCALAASLAVLWGGVGIFRWREGEITNRIEATLPVSAAQFLAQSHLPGPLFNSFNWGGYLIWALPEYPVSMDGRTNQYSSDQLLQNVAAWDGKPEWRKNIDLGRSNLVLAERQSALTPVLELSPDFESVYSDDHAVVFRRKH